MRRFLRTAGILLTAFLVGMAWGWAEQSKLARQMLDERLPASVGQQDVFEETH